MNFLSKQRILGIAVLIALLAIGVAILLHRNQVRPPLMDAKPFLVAAKPPASNNVFLITKPSPTPMPSPTASSTQATAATTLASSTSLGTSVASVVPTSPTTANAAASNLSPAVHRAITHTPLAAVTVKPASVAATHQWQAQTVFPTGWLVQVGSFKSRRDAQQLARQLRGKGFSARVQKVHTGVQGTMTRVVVGEAHLTQHQAHKLQQQLAKKMQLKSFLIQTGVSHTQHRSA